MKKIMIFLILLTFIGILGAFFLQEKLAPITDKYVQNKAQYVGNKIINDCVANVMDEVGTNDFFILEKDSAGKIISENTNVVAMNLFKSKLHNELNDAFNNIGENNFGVPIFNIIGFDWMSGFGPKIRVKLLYNGNIEADFENEFTASGINQTKHIIYIKTKAEVWAVVSGRQILCQIDNKMPIAETIILGDVPSVYLNGGLK